VIDNALGAGNAGRLARDLADVAETNGNGAGIGNDVVVAFELGVGSSRGERLGLPFVVDRLGRGAIDAGPERGLGGLNAVDIVGEVFAVANAEKVD
jgi:hypothetical protein